MAARADVEHQDRPNLADLHYKTELAMILEHQMAPGLVCEHSRVNFRPIFRLTELAAIRGSTSAVAGGCVNGIVGIDLESAC